MLACCLALTWINQIKTLFAGTQKKQETQSETIRNNSCVQRTSPLKTLFSPENMSSEDVAARGPSLPEVLDVWQHTCVRHSDDLGCPRGPRCVQDVGQAVFPSRIQVLWSPFLSAVPSPAFLFSLSRHQARRHIFPMKAEEHEVLMLHGQRVLVQ